MTTEEMRAVISRTNDADGRCFVCAGRIAYDLAERFPKHKEVIEKTYGKAHDRNFSDLEEEALV